MYLDTVGKVTVGVGNMLPSIEAAHALPFIHADDKQAAYADEVGAEFELVSAQKKGMLAKNYKKFTRLILTDDYIDKLLEIRLGKFEKQLRIDFPDYDQYPEKARMGLVDMAFNLGNKGLVSKFPTFSKGARKRDWLACAAECKRQGISDTRNEEVASLFLECAE